MKTGDDTFDDIYVSKDTGKVVGVMYEDVDYKLVPIKQEDEAIPLVEEPEKAIVNKSEAEAINALINADRYVDLADPFKYLFTSRNKEDIKRLIKAIRNGYTVAKEKKYLVYKVLGGKQKNKHEQVAQAYRSKLFFDTIIWLIKEHKIMSSDASDQFTEAEIEHYGLQDCEKVWCDSDD
jgi:hypothetical protein